MNFSDAELKRLKERPRVPGLDEIESKTDALLARLEAAERVCLALGQIVIRCNHKPEGWDDTDKEYQKWLETK